MKFFTKCLLALSLLTVATAYAQIPGLNADKGKDKGEKSGSEQTETVHSSNAHTTGEDEIPLDELQIKLVPLTKEQLFAEADGWYRKLQDIVHKLSLVKLEIKQVGDRHAH